MILYFVFIRQSSEFHGIFCSQDDACHRIVEQSPPNIKPPTHTPAAQYTRSNASHAIAKLHFPQTLQPFSQFERNVISNLTTGPKLISILDVFHDASNQGKEFFSQSMGICLRQTYGPSTSPIRWRDAGMTVLMNIARVIYRGSSLLRTSRGRILETRAPRGRFRFPAHYRCRAESKR